MINNVPVPTPYSLSATAKHIIIHIGTYTTIS